VLVEDVAREGEGAIAERLRDVLAAPFVLAGTPASGDAEAAEAALSLQVSACVGAVALDPGRDADAVLRHAALALARARGAGSGRVELFTPALHAEARERDELAAALRAAVEESGDGRLGPAFSLVFQPVVDLTTGDAPSVEALLRWRHPTIGPVSPATFIPLAEELGLVSTLGQQVLGAACAAVARLDEGATAAGLVVAVNVSGHQLQRRDFADDVAAALRASGLPPARLTLEVTETALVRDPRRARRVLGEIRALGVRVAIDDFGTGYSSLAYLQQLPLDVLKIDKRFVDGVGLGRGPALAIPRAIVALGRALGLRTVAEGIETAAQRDALHALGCTSGQGYLFARPLPLAELRAWLAARAEAHGAAPAAPSVV
jgi:EAL domain-containing protein (putative c-di-GMP-specific phosphodiesterase class I)